MRTVKTIADRGVEQHCVVKKNNEYGILPVINFPCYKDKHDYI